MKWITKRHRPVERDKRNKRKFALFPTTIGKYTVWLESYESVQVYQYRPRPTKAGTINCYGWDEIERNLLVLYP